MDRLAGRVAKRYLEQALVYRVAARYMRAMEFPTPEALKKYLKEHPHADPARHTVKKHEEKREKSEGKTKLTPSLFDAKETEKLPEIHQQKEKDPDKLFEHAKEAQKQQVRWLGNDIKKALGAYVVRGDHEETPDFSKKGPIIYIGPMKKKDRSAEKVKTDYGGDWSRLGDIVRASVAVDSVHDLPKVMNVLKKNGLKLARKPKDRFETPTDAGYRDLTMNVKYPNGHVGELQLHVKSMLHAKNAGHKLYEKVRSIGAKAKETGRTKLTDNEMKAIDEANNKMKAIYDKAWKQAQGGATVESKKAFEMDKTASKKYYDYGGVPAYWEGHNFPKCLSSGGTEHVIYDLDKFFQDATPINEHAFNEMKKAL